MADDSTLSTFERILLLQRGRGSRVSVSGAVSAGQLSLVAEQMRERSFRAGSVLLREGETPPASYSLVRGDVRLTRRGQFLGQVGPGATIGFAGIISRDPFGIGAVAASDVLALELDGETLGDIFDDHFPFLLEVMRETARRHLDLVRNLEQFPDRLPSLHGEPFRFDRMDLVERLLFLRSHGGPFERSSVDALAEFAQRARHRSFDPGAVLWREGDRAGQIVIVARGTIACASSRDRGSLRFRAVPGVALGSLESIGGLPRWHDAVAETPVEVFEHEADDLIDVFEDNVEMAMDFLAFLTSTALTMIEQSEDPLPRLFAFFTGSQPSFPDRRVAADTTP